MWIWRATRSRLARASTFCGAGAVTTRRGPPSRRPSSSRLENAGGLRYGNARALRALVTEAKRRIDRCLRRSLFDTYGLYDHVFAAKRYLLMGQGDFHAVLMDAVGADLDEPAGGLSAYALTGALETATRASNAQFDPPEILDKLRVATARGGVGSEETGWDVFSLRYATSAPLDVVFTPEAESKYLRVFTFLWRLKRVEVSLNATWQTMKPNVAASLERDGVAGPAGAALAAELRRCHTLRGEMHHFVSNLQYYVMFEVLEGSWDAFTRELNDADDLDALVQAHDTFLDAVTRKSLLSPASQLLAHTLGAIFDAILRFRAFADRLYEVAKDAAMRRQLAQLRVEQREKSGEQGGLGDHAGGGPQRRRRVAERRFRAGDAFATRRALRRVRQDAGRVPEPLAAPDARRPAVPAVPAGLLRVLLREGAGAFGRRSVAR